MRFNAFTSLADLETDLYDVVIVGGGVSGLTLAAALSKTSQLKVALVESMSLEPASNWDPSADVYSNRCSSLTPSSRNYLMQIGAWDHIAATRIQQYKNMRVWDGVSDARITFDSEIQAGVNSERPLAYMAENINLQNGLLAYLAADSSEKVTIWDKTKVQEISYGPKLTDVDLTTWPKLSLDNGSQMITRLLIGADGVMSPVRQFAGIESRGWDYGQHGVVASLDLEWDDFQSVAWQRFLPTGPIALLPLPDGKASLVWTTTPKLASHLKSLDSDGFCTMVNAAFRLSMVDINYMYNLTDSSELETEFEWRDELLPLEDEAVKYPIRVVKATGVASFPLRMRHCDCYSAPRIALVGDAAHTTHPLAGQGLNLGQGDIASLAPILEMALSRGQDIGDETVLQEYWANRYPINHFMLGVVDKLQKLYCTDFPPLVALRSAGLEIVDNVPFLKQFIVAQATGA
ncbi:uncharacterized protein V1516DRAFT_705767 [Lipomyces oligophaga]|uniref:uncharacterized protein n=1 Tax=Lipomyces oligophaga TaxID=45792 RepID=UPI0034CEDECC